MKKKYYLFIYSLIFLGAINMNLMSQDIAFFDGENNNIDDLAMLDNEPSGATDAAGDSVSKTRITHLNMILDEINTTIYKDAEDGEIINLYKYNKNGVYTIENIYDADKNSRVIHVKTTGNSAVGLKAGYFTDFDRYDAPEWNNTTDNVIRFDLKTNSDYEIKIIVNGTVAKNNGKYARVIHLITHAGYSFSGEPSGETHIYYALGDNTKDGNWHTFTVDLNDILDGVASGCEVSNLKFIMFYGDVYVDNITAMHYSPSPVADVTSPVIHLNGTQDTTIFIGSTYSDPGASVEDNVDSGLSVNIDASAVNTSTEGRYFVAFNATDNADNAAQTVYRIVNVRPDCIVIGPRQVFSTPVSMGTLFVAPSAMGNGNGFSAANACSWDEFVNNKRNHINPSDVVFFRGGTYYFPKNGPYHPHLYGGTKDLPVTYESYPNETALFRAPDNVALTGSDNMSFHMVGCNIRLRKVEIAYMPWKGLVINGKYNIIEGCNVHHSRLTGIENLNVIDGHSSGGLGGSYNIVRDTKSHHNSDVGLTAGDYNDGGNADGITFHYGRYNVIDHNETYLNSDDGMDGWLSFATRFTYNKTHENGHLKVGGTGDGEGIKLGGNYKTPGACVSEDCGCGQFHVAKHNLMYDNSRYGEKENMCRYAIVQYNTAYKNAKKGYTLSGSLTHNVSLSAVRNIAFSNNEGIYEGESPILQSDNSWNIGHAVVAGDFISLDTASVDFLRPTAASPIVNMGAYADESSLSDITPPVLAPIGDREDTVIVGNAYLDKGARAYDDVDSWITNISVDDSNVNTNSVGKYTVIYSASDAAGNTGTCKRTVNVITNVSTSLNDVNNNIKTGLKVFPNPTNGLVNIELNSSVNGEILITVMNVAGNTMKIFKEQKDAEAFTKQMDLSNLGQGMYIIYIYDGKDSVFKKLIIR